MEMKIHMVHNVDKNEICYLADAIAVAIQEALAEEHDGRWSPTPDERALLLEFVFEELKKPTYWKD